MGLAVGLRPEISPIDLGIRRSTLTKCVAFSSRCSMTENSTRQGLFN